MKLPINCKKNKNKKKARTSKGKKKEMLTSSKHVLCCLSWIISWMRELICCILVVIVRFAWQPAETRQEVTVPGLKIVP